MTTFTFPYGEERTRAGAVVFRPHALVFLQAADGTWRPFRLYADAGADITLLRADDCRLLGYRLKAGQPLWMGGIGRGLVRAYLHQVPIRLGTVEFKCQVAFTARARAPRLLGRSDVLTRFEICYEVARLTRFILRET